MLETIDAEKFCSGHSEMADRQDIQNHIDQVQVMQPGFLFKYFLQHCSSIPPFLDFSSFPPLLSEL
jgi:hypothetical protein